MQTPPFIILSLPRSRSAWLSAFLSYPPKRCGHDIGAESSSIPDFLNRLGQYDGSCETGAVIGWQLIRKFISDATIIVIKRPVADVEISLLRCGIVAVPGEMQERRAMLDACAEADGVTSIEFDELNDEDVCRMIFEGCLNIAFDRKWWKRMAKKNIQVDVNAQFNRLLLRQPELTRLKRDVALSIQEDADCAAL